MGCSQSGWRRAVFVFGLTFFFAALIWTFVDRVYLQSLRPTILCDRIQIEVDNAIANGCECGVEVRNTGSLPLVISEVKLSCGSCLRLIEFPKRPMPSGEVQRIRLRVLPNKVSAGDIKRVTVFSNDPRSPRLTLLVKINS